MKSSWHPHERSLSLRSLVGQMEEPPAWLNESWEDPQGFYRGLKRSLDSLFTIHGASALFNTYDFFHDIIHRNRTHNYPAMVWFRGDGERRELSWEELGRRASIKAAKWERHGLKAGECLCVIREVGPELATDLLAAFKLGAVVSLLPTEARGFILRRLTALDPQWIATDSRTVKKLGEWNERVLPMVATRCDIPSDHRHFHGYASGETVFRLFSRGSSSEIEAVEISSDAAYLSAACSGLLGLGIYPGMRLCTPDFDLLLCQPFLLLSSLLCGATYVHVTQSDLLHHKGLPTGAKPDVFGVTPWVRDLFLKERSALEVPCARWFKDPVSSLEYDRWQLFAGANGFEEVPAFNLRWDAAKGGCLLFSMGRKGIAHPGVLPMPGALWSVGEEGSEDAALFQTGELHLASPGTEATCLEPCGVTLSAHGEIWLCTGGAGTQRQGMACPVDEITAFLNERGRGLGVIFETLTFPRSDLKGGEQMVVIGFTGARNVPSFLSRLKKEAEQLIEKEMGPWALPDGIWLYPLYPRFESPGVSDRKWCRDAWLSGVLARRAKHPVFLCTTRLRSHLVES